MEAGFPAMPSARTRVATQVVLSKHLYCVDNGALHRLPTDSAESLSWRSSKATWTLFWATCSGWPSWAGLGKVASRSPYQPQSWCSLAQAPTQTPVWFCDSENMKSLISCVDPTWIIKSCIGWFWLHSPVKLALFEWSYLVIN